MPLDTEDRSAVVRLDRFDHPVLGRADDVAGGAVLQVMQTGYELMGRIVRPAMVVVAAKGSGATATPKESGLDPYAGASDDAGSTLDTKA